MAEFGMLDLEDMAGEDTRLANEGGNNNANFLDQFVPMPDVKPGQTGSVSIRILPPSKGAKLFQYNRTHKINGRSIHCPRPLINGKWDKNTPCPICDYYASLWRQIDKLEKAHGKDCPQAEPLKDEAREIKPQERFYYNAIVRSLVVDGKEVKNVGPRILSVGKLLHAQIIRAIVGAEGDPDSKLGNIADLKSGWDFIIRKTVTPGQDAFPKYDQSSFARNPSPAGTPEDIAKWAEGLHDLTKLRNPRELEYLERELAIHRHLIVDDNTSAFDTDAFDAKWGSKAGSEMQAVLEKTGSSTKAQVSVPASTPEPEIEDLAIEEEDFLKQIESMSS